MLIGQSRHSLDAKGRLIVPGRFRSDLGESFVITKGLDGCLFAYPVSEWDKLVAKIKEAPMVEGRKMQRFFFANAEEMTPDAQGRVVLSQSLRQAAALKKDVILIGVENRMEIWDAENWENYEESASDMDIISAMEKIGF